MVLFDVVIRNDEDTAPPHTVADMLDIHRFFAYLSQKDELRLKEIVKKLSDEEQFWSHFLGHVVATQSIEVLSYLKEIEILSLYKIAIGASGSARFDVLDYFAYTIREHPDFAAQMMLFEAIFSNQIDSVIYLRNSKLIPNLDYTGAWITAALYGECNADLIDELEKFIIGDRRLEIKFYAAIVSYYTECAYANEQKYFCLFDRAIDMLKKNDYDWNENPLANPIYCTLCKKRYDLIPYMLKKDIPVPPERLLRRFIHHPPLSDDDDAKILSMLGLLNINSDHSMLQ